MPKIIKTKNTKPKKTAIPAKVKSTKTKKSTCLKCNPVDYYACLTSMAQAGFPNKITACCRECKTKAPALNVQRQQELQQWVKNYQKLGADFLHLFTPPHSH